MNKTKKLTLSMVFTTCCILGATTASYAQGKVIKSFTQSGRVVPRLSRGVQQSFVFPKNVARAVERGVAEGKFNLKPTHEVTANIATAWEIAQTQSPRELRFFNHKLVATPTVEKDLLMALRAEDQFYSAEIDVARAIRNEIFNITVLSPEGQAQIAHTILEKIKNHSLKATLLDELDNYDIYNMAQDLTDYFCLDKTFENAAFDYTVRHPHQSILNLRRLLHNPVIDAEAKENVKFYLNKNALTETEDLEGFRQAIQTVHNQYTQRIAAAKNSEVVQGLAAYYQELIDRTENFIVKNGRAPKWNTRSQQEHDLFEDISFVLEHQAINSFSPLTTYAKQLRHLLEKSPVPVLSKTETLELFEEFVRTTGRRYPRSQSHGANKGIPAFNKEELLWDSLFHWRLKNEGDIMKEVRKVLEKYPEARGT